MIKEPAQTLKRQSSRIAILSLLFLAIIFPCIAPAEDIQIVATQADKHIGQYAIVCGKVVSTKYVDQEHGQPTYLNFGYAFPDQVFSVVIWNEHRTKFSFPPEETYLRQHICVRGMIGSFQGKPQLEVRSPMQISLEGEGLSKNILEMLIDDLINYTQSLFQ